jgi:hypothetical protein
MSSARLSTTHVSIQECASSRDILKHCTYNTTVLFDLDNTILRPTRVHDLGSDQWYRKMYERALEKIKQRAHALNSAIALNSHIQKHIQVKSVEAGTPRIIHMLQDVHLTTLAVTARGYDMAETTLQQLRKIGVAFSDNLGGSFSFQIEEKTIFYKNGVLFCDGVNKGLCLAAFLHLQHVQCGRVVMMDDVEENLLKVGDVLRTGRFEFHGLRYNHLDARVASFDFKRANVKLSTVSSLFSTSVKNIIESLELDGYQSELKEKPVL